MARVTECDRDRTGAAPARAGGRDRDAVLYPFPALGCEPGGAAGYVSIGKWRTRRIGCWTWRSRRTIVLCSTPCRGRLWDGVENVGIIRRFCLNLVRLHAQKNSSTWFQSTRPRRGATATNAGSSKSNSSFNPRAPEGARLARSSSNSVIGQFQSTRPRRGATNS